MIINAILIQYLFKLNWVISGYPPPNLPSLFSVSLISAVFDGTQWESPLVVSDYY